MANRPGREVTFIHTADWQLGKPFAGVADLQKRSRIQQERFDVLPRVAAAAAAHQAQFVVVAGDLFDSPSVTKATVSAACAAIGSMKIPVFAISGNHDHGGPGSVWEQPFFQREREQLAPNLTVLLEPKPVTLDAAVLFPCPLQRKHEASDPTAWLRSTQAEPDHLGDRPRVVLAHGSVQDFSTPFDEDETAVRTINRIDLSRLAGQAFDYIALGDWHGTKQVGPKAWYAGTPELDRFPKGETNDPGNILVVTAGRSTDPVVKSVRTGRLGWHELVFDFADDAALAELERRISALTGGRTGLDLLHLELRGSLGIEASALLEEKLESWHARFLRLELYNRSIIAPTGEEIELLARRAADPLISRVAACLIAQASGSGEDAVIARVALRELHAACRHE